MRFTTVATAAILSFLVIAGCGEGAQTTTTIIREAAPPRAPSHSQPEAKQPQPNPDPQPAPNVVGLSLDAAEKILDQAGYETAASNTDTAFGIVVTSHFKVCEQDEARGAVVPVLAQKYGC